MEVIYDGKHENETYVRILSEFVPRELSKLTNAGVSHNDKINQVLRQLQAGKAKVVYYVASETCNIVPVT